MIDTPIEGRGRRRAADGEMPLKDVRLQGRGMVIGGGLVGELRRFFVDALDGGVFGGKLTHCGHLWMSGGRNTMVAITAYCWQEERCGQEWARLKGKLSIALRVWGASCWGMNADLIKRGFETDKIIAIPTVLLKHKRRVSWLCTMSCCTVDSPAKRNGTNTASSTPSSTSLHAISEQTPPLCRIPKINRENQAFAS